MSPAPTHGDELRGYFDSASGLPPSPLARRALASAWATAWQDPGRRYPAGRQARTVLDQARASVADVLGVPAAGVHFVGSPDRAVWLGITGLLPPDGRIVTSAVEDLMVLRSCDHLARRGVPVTEIPVDETGTVAPAELGAAAASGPPAVVVLQDGNLEVGTRQPVAEVRERLPGVPLLLDARAVLGREPVSAGWDALVADPRMWGGPAGLAVLAVRDSAAFRPDVPRTDGHGGVESEAVPVPIAAAAALALEEATAAGPWRTRPLLDRLAARVLAEIPDARVLGHPTSRLSYLAMLSLLYVAADELVDELGRRGWAVASGASCTSDTRRPHHVLVAMGALTHGSLRVSAGPWTTESEIDALADDITDVVVAIRRESGAVGL